MTNGRKLETLLQGAEYTWVYYWIPYCGSALCRPLSDYEKLAKDAHKNLRLVVISQIYDYADVQQKVELDGYTHPILVPHIQVYGKGYVPGKKAFHRRSYQQQSTFQTDAGAHAFPAR